MGQPDVLSLLKEEKARQELKSRNIKRSWKLSLSMARA
jgi:hypothetical protein